MLVGTILEPEFHSWQEVLKPGEVLGGPSPWGNSKYSVFKRCPYLFYWMFVKRMGLVAFDKNLEVGGLYHEARARYAQAWLDNTDDHAQPTISQKDIDDLCKMSGFEIINRASDLVPEYSAEARRLYTAWLAKYGPTTPLDYRASIYGVEVLLEVSEPFKYSARIDQWLWNTEADGPEINEIKSAARRDAQLLKSYKMDAQFLGQIYLWEKVNKKKWGSLKKFTIDLVTKGKENIVDPRSIPINKVLLRDWEKGMKVAYADLVGCQMTNVWPQRQGYHHCRYCPAFDHCASGRKTHIGWRKKKKGEY